MNVFEKLKELKPIIADVYPMMSWEEIRDHVQFIANSWHGCKRRKGVKLTKQQMTIYELLLKHKYNPMTVYKWFLLTDAPDDLIEKVRYGRISIHAALKEKRMRKTRLSVTEREFIDAIIDCVERYVSEAGEGYPGKVST